MAGMAASMSLFRRNIDGSDKDLVKFDRTTQDVGRNIDKLSGRLGLLVDVAATLGPALIPTAAAAVPLLAGLSNQLGFAAIAGGSTILAFQGVGDALKALNEQQLNPSAANLEKLHEAMAQLGPAGKDFVRELQAMRPELERLQSLAQAGLFPGMTEGIDSLVTRVPQVERIISQVTDTLGGLLADAGKSLAGPQWDDFFNMLESEARPSLEDLGQSIGQITKGLADLWVAFAPLNRDFSRGMLGASKSFADWADGLSKTQGFADFVAYLDKTGPQVAQTLGALSKALLDVLEAAAPLGGPALAAIKAFSTAISAIANSNVGPPLLAAVAALRAFSLASTIAGKATSSAWGAKATAGAKTYGSALFNVVSAQERANTAAGKTTRSALLQRSAWLRGAAGAAALGVAATGVADRFGAANTATLGLAGAMLGPWGAAAGAGVGAFLDLKAAGESFGDTLDRLNLASKSGNIEAIAKQIKAAKDQVADINKTSGFGDFFSDIGKTKGASLANLIPGASIESEAADDAIAHGQNAKAWAELATVVSKAATTSALAANGFRLTAAGAREAAGGVNAFAFAVRGANAALTRQGTLDAYRASLLDMADALKANGKTLATNTRAGLANRAALRNIASSALEAAGNMKNFANRTQFLQRSRKDFVSFGRQLGLTKAQAKSLADQLGLIDRIHATPRIDEQGAANSRARIAKMRSEIERLKPKSVQVSQKGADDAKAKVLQLKAAIAALRDKQVHVTVVRNTRGGSAPGGGVANQPGVDGSGADGATVPKTGKPYADRHLYLLADGEEIISNRYGQADRFRADRASGRIPQYADGGTIGRLADGGEARRRNGNDPTPHVNHFAQALKEATKSLNKEKSARDALISKRNDLSGTVRDQFLTDPFGQSNIWAAGGGNPLGILKADIAKANAFKSTLGALKKQGLDGNALASIASTGNIGQAQALLAGGKGGISAFESAFNQRAKAAAAVGAYAGNAAYGAAIVSQSKDIKQLNATVHRLEQQLKHRHGENKKDRKKNAHEVGAAAGKAVNSGAGKGTRRSRGRR